MRLVVSTGLVAVMLAGCAPTIDSHGYAPTSEDLQAIAVGQDTKGSVRRKVGRPSTTGVFLEDGWYYVATEIENYLFYAPRVADRRVVAIRFDQNEVVAAVNEYGLEDGRVVDLETRTTPTLGRELTVLQQLLGNIGVFSPETVLDN